MSNPKYCKLNEEKSRHTFKLVLLGDSSVGKTSIARRMTSNTFSEFQESTIGASFMTKHFETSKESINYEIWDTAGQERYRSLAPMYYRGAHCVFLVFDLTNRDSYEAIKNWEKEIKNNAKDVVLTILIGNKSDLCVSRQIAEREVEEYAESISAKYYETSAKSGIRINTMLDYMNKMLPRLHKTPVTESLSLDRECRIPGRRSKCC